MENSVSISWKKGVTSTLIVIFLFLTINGAMATSIEVEVDVDSDTAKQSYTSCVGFTKTDESLAVVSAAGGGDNQLISAIKFNNITISQGSEITAAHLELYAPQANVNPHTKIYAHDIDNSTNFDDVASICTRTRTTNYTIWNSTVSIYSYSDSDDITGIVQEVVNRPGWVSGNSIMIIMMPHEVSLKYYYFSGKVNNQEPRLNITYIANQIPIVTTTLINPTTAYTNNDLTCNVTATDKDNSTFSIEYWWYNSTTLMEHGNHSGYLNGTNTQVSTLGKGNTTKNELWNCTVRPYDGIDYGSYNSSTINISNTAPTIASATISPSPANDANDLTCLNSTIADIDGDSVTAEYTWYNNSVRVTDLTEQIVGNGNTTLGDSWYCMINVTDGTDYSGAVTSQTVVIGSADVAPTLNTTNATTAFTTTVSDATNPTANNSWVNLSIRFHDDNSGEKWTAYFCKTNVFNGFTCAGGQFCNSGINSTDNPTTCKYIVENETGTTINYYVYVVDNSTLFQGSGSGLAGSFVLNYPPGIPTITFPTNNTWTNINSTLIQMTGTDPDSDNITWHIFADNTSDPTTLVNFTTGAIFNWTGLNETTYYIKVMANDTHGYISQANSTVVIRNFDFTAPILQNTTISSTGPYTDETVTITVDCYDALSGMNTTSTDFNITDPLLATNIETMTLLSGSYTDIYVPLGVVGTYDIGTFRCYDIAGNLASNISTLQFTSVVRTTGGGGGGGSYNPPPISAVDLPPIQAVQTLCGNGICEQGETPATCFVDCPVNVDRFITCLWDPEINCLYGESWFVTLLLLIVFGGAIFIQVQAEQKKNSKRQRR